MKQFYINPQICLGGIVYSGNHQEIVHLSLKKGKEVPDDIWAKEVSKTLFAHPSERMDKKQES